MIELILRNTRLLILVTALLIVSGLSALQSLPRAEDPLITNRNAAITTHFPGATPERVEALVTEKIETELRTSMIFSSSPRHPVQVSQWSALSYSIPSLTLNRCGRESETS
ncbi:AcrB/AcrD/AcrF family protein [Vibrio astriarenae]|nr:AcrB/AcrD/AcrF family protein [Vibrio sp. C7]